MSEEARIAGGFRVETEELLSLRRRLEQAGWRQVFAHDQIEESVSHNVGLKRYGCGSKFKSWLWQTAGFSLCFHLPRGSF